MGRPLGWVYWEPHARPKVALMLPQGHATEAPKDQVVVGVVTGVPDGQILKQTVLQINDVLRPGPHHFSTADHDPCLAVPIPQHFVREEVLNHVLKTFLCHCCRYRLVVLVAVRRLQICIEYLSHEKIGL